MKRTLKCILCMFLSFCMLLPGLTVSAGNSLSQVKGLKLKSNDATTQTISWNAVSKSTGYQVYQYNSTTQSYKKIATTTKLTYTIKNLKNAKSYYYKVRAYNRTTYGAYSNVLKTATIGKPSNFVLTEVTTKAQTISWKAVKGASGYRVYCYINGGWVKLKDTTATSLRITALTPGTDYKYMVRSYIKKSSFTSFGTGASAGTYTTKPIKVSSFVSTGTTGSTSATLKWTADPQATGYQILKLNEKTGKYSVAANKIKNNSYKLTGLEPSSKYTLKVRSYCSRHNTVYGAASDALDVFTGPIQVVGVKNEVNGDTIKFTWDIIPEVSGYEVQTLDVASKKWITCQSSLATTYTAVNLGYSEVVYLRVRGYINTQDGPLYGDYSKICTSVSEPASPSRTAVVLITDDQTGQSRVYGVKVAWDEVEGATGYTVYRKLKSQSDDEWAFVCRTNDTICEDYSITESGTYIYKVISYCVVSGNITTGPSTILPEIDYTYTESIKRSSLEELIRDIGLIGYTYDSVGHCWTTADDPWQRNLGYTIMFDVAAPFVIIWYDTMRIKFNYDNYDWMIQLWKGQYGWVMKGCEVGVYTMKPGQRIEYYSCADDNHRLQMSVEFYYKQLLSDEYKMVFFRPYATYWWCTGFVPGANYLDHGRIRMDVRITLKTYEMLDAFCEALEKLGYTKDATFQRMMNSYTVDGLDVYFSYQ